MAESSFLPPINSESGHYELGSFHSLAGTFPEYSDEEAGKRVAQSEMAIAPEEKTASGKDSQLAKSTDLIQLYKTESKADEPAPYETYEPRYKGSKYNSYKQQVHEHLIKNDGKHVAFEHFEKYGTIQRGATQPVLDMEAPQRYDSRVLFSYDFAASRPSDAPNARYNIMQKRHSLRKTGLVLNGFSSHPNDVQKDVCEGNLRLMSVDHFFDGEPLPKDEQGNYKIEEDDEEKLLKDPKARLRHAILVAPEYVELKTLEGDDDQVKQWRDALNIITGEKENPQPLLGGKPMDNLLKTFFWYPYNAEDEHQSCEIGPGRLCVAYELCWNGTLGDMLTTGLPLSDHWMRHWTLQLTAALQHLHSLDIVHGNLSAHACGLTNFFDLRLRDWESSYLGLCRQDKTDKHIATANQHGVIGHKTEWLPPTDDEDEEITHKLLRKIDLLALGVLLSKMATGEYFIAETQLQTAAAECVTDMDVVQAEIDARYLAGRYQTTHHLHYIDPEVLATIVRLVTANEEHGYSYLSEILEDSWLRPTSKSGVNYDGATPNDDQPGQRGAVHDTRSGFWKDCRHGLPHWSWTNCPVASAINKDAYEATNFITINGKHSDTTKGVFEHLIGQNGKFFGFLYAFAKSNGVFMGIDEFAANILHDTAMQLAADADPCSRAPVRCQCFDSVTLSFNGRGEHKHPDQMTKASKARQTIWRSREPTIHMSLTVVDNRSYNSQFVQ